MIWPHIYQRLSWLFIHQLKCKSPSAFRLMIVAFKIVRFCRSTFPFCCGHYGLVLINKSIQIIEWTGIDYQYSASVNAVASNRNIQWEWAVTRFINLHGSSTSDYWFIDDTSRRSWQHRNGRRLHLGTLNSIFTFIQMTLHSIMKINLNEKQIL